MKWREDLAPSAEKNGELPLETFENQGALINELYSRVFCAISKLHEYNTYYIDLLYLQLKCKI